MVDAFAQTHRQCRKQVQLMNTVCFFAGLIEHAAWTPGDAYLATPLKNMPWYQQILLDVLAVCSAVTAVLAVASLWMYRWCSRHFGKHVKVA